MRSRGIPYSGDPSESPTATAFKRVGVGVTIHRLAQILNPHAISLGSDVIVDDFVFIGDHREVIIGSHVHLASHASITGGGVCVIGDFAGVSSGARVLSGSDDLVDGRLTGPTIPAAYRSVTRGWVTIGRHAVVGANAVVLPNIEIGEGAIVGAGAVINRHVEPWTVVVGQPGRVIRRRDAGPVLEAERALRQKVGAPGPEVRGTLEDVAE